MKQTEIAERRDGVEIGRSVTILGGDARMLACAHALEAKGRQVLLCGFEDDPAVQEECLEITEAVSRAETVVLPLPASKDGQCVFAPFARHRIELSDELAASLRGKQVFCGMIGRLPKKENWQALPVIDYYRDERLLAANARITAEAALFEAMNVLSSTLYDCRCLVTGFGRIGKALTAQLCGMGIPVIVAARKAKDREQAQKLGAHAVSFDEIAPPCEVVFNTVPAPVVSTASWYPGKPVLYLELASSSGLLQAPPSGIHVLQAASLPGKYAPDSAGRAIAAVLLDEGEEAKI